MKNFTKSGLLPLLALIFAGCGVSEYIPPQNELTVDSVYDCIETKDAELELAITYDTTSCPSQYGLDRIYIRGIKTKKTGITGYQIYLISFDANRQDPYQLNYKFGDDIISAKANKINSDVSCFSGNCAHVEDVAFEISKDYLADLSARYDEIKDDGLITVRVQNRNGDNQDYLLNPAKLVGMYRTVEGIR